ncbi:hypothetical protein [Tabrizicola sp.]|uniref:hypothetical protein n=1 Tax=Tabrizicola sp. TaxID=2005166 RepID=UPI001A54085C|nr:hypothetical protein [Tabrizicola sp.]MBL9062754.1 hypothetical protein [Tabrizicola sp.]
MADALPAVLAEYVAARDNVRAIVAEWSPQWPVPGEQIIRYGAGCKDHRTLDGWGIELPWGNRGVKRMPQIGTPDYFDAAAKRHEEAVARIEAKGGRRDLHFHRKWAESERAAIEPARAFWAEVDRITAASGIEAAKARLARAEAALKSAVDQIMLAADKTITGTVIKAQAMTAWAEVDGLSRVFNDRGTAWADLLAASIVKQAA